MPGRRSDPRYIRLAYVNNTVEDKDPSPSVISLYSHSAYNVRK